MRKLFQSKDLFDRTQNLSRTTELLFPKMPKFTTNEKFLENFVLIFAKDNTDCFLFCNLGSTLLKREDLLKFVFFFEVAYLKVICRIHSVTVVGIFGHKFHIMGIFGKFLSEFVIFRKSNSVFLNRFCYR